MVTTPVIAALAIAYAIHTHWANAAGETRHIWPTPPASWIKQARCITWAESRDTNATSNPYSRGWFQITWATWRSVGGHGDPVQASYAEQRYRAYLIWRRDGGSWIEWSTRTLCHLH